MPDCYTTVDAFPETQSISYSLSLFFTLKMTFAQVVETPVTITDNSPSQDHTHPGDQTKLSHVAPGFKPFTVGKVSNNINIALKKFHVQNVTASQIRTNTQSPTKSNISRPS